MSCLIACLRKCFPCCKKEVAPVIQVRPADTVVHQVSRQMLGQAQGFDQVDPLDSYSWKPMTVAEMEASRSFMPPNEFQNVGNK